MMLLVVGYRILRGIIVLLHIIGLILLVLREVVLVINALANIKLYNNN